MGSAAFLVEAKKYNVLPLDDRLAERFDVTLRPNPLAGLKKFTYGPGVTGIGEGTALNTHMVPFTITAEVEVGKTGADGVLAAIGVDQDFRNITLQSSRTALSDGWGGSMLATDLQDILFGTPSPRNAQVNLGVLKKDQVNILVHGHNPIVSEKILEAVNEISYCYAQCL